MTPRNLQPVAESLRRVVIADADDDARLMYREALAGLPLDIVEAVDGRAALVQCLVEPPSLVIVDTHLTAITGLELCLILRHDRQTHTVPILMVTSDNRPGELTRMRQVGATRVLTKPIAMEQFLSEVADLSTASIAEPANDATAADAPAPALRAASKAYRRFDTVRPPKTPPSLRCRACDVALDYVKSRVGGVTRSDPEQWDEFRCTSCAGRFEYRHRTRSLRSAL